MNNILVLGGTGFVGRSLCEKLVSSAGASGGRIVVPSRRPYRAAAIRSLPTVEVVPADILLHRDLHRLVQAADVVINLVAVLHGSADTFNKIHVDFPRRLSKVCLESGTKRLVHVSALGVRPDAPSRYLRSKAAGEEVLRTSGLAVTLSRPSVIFGPGDGIFERFAKMAVISPALPLIGGGATKFQPVFVGDVAKAIARLLADFDFAGHTFELAGPETLTFRQILEVVRAETQRSPVLVPLPFFAAGLIGKLGDLMAFVLPPPLTSDQVEMLKVDNIAGGDAPGLAELGVAPTTVGSVVGGYLFRYRPGGQYAENLKRAAPAA